MSERPLPWEIRYFSLVKPDRAFGIILSRKNIEMKTIFKNNKISLYRVLSELLSPSKISSRWLLRVWIKYILYLISTVAQKASVGWQKCIGMTKSGKDEMSDDFYDPSSKEAANGFLFLTYFVVIHPRAVPFFKRLFYN